MKARGVSALLSAVKVQDAFKTIRAGTGATGEKPRALQDEFKKFARTVPNSYQETATAIADLNTGPGLSGQPLWKMGRAMPDVTGSIKLPEGVALVMPGDNSPFEVELMAPVPMNEQLRCAFREGDTPWAPARSRRASTEVIPVTLSRGFKKISRPQAADFRSARQGAATMAGLNTQSGQTGQGASEHGSVRLRSGGEDFRTSGAAAHPWAARGARNIARRFRGIVDAVKNAAVETGGHRHCREDLRQRRCFKPFSRRKTAFLVCKKCVLKLFQ